MKLRYILLIALLLNGCVSPLPQVSVKTDEFSRNVELMGPASYENPLGGVFRVWRLRSFVNKDTHAVSHQLYIDLEYSTYYRKGFKFAADDTGKNLRVIKLYSAGKTCSSNLNINNFTNTTDVVCNMSDYIAVTVGDAALRSHAHTGYKIKLSAQDGDGFILPITPQMIRLQLEAVDKYAR